ncbi:MAG: hypothetical protein A3G51_04055 [Candidatus Yanofskybacteria bacterium RIFCSPLOWO2_12_FULL_43_11b]|uniref:Uncharacterized protein n=1 Tax=Candidatus Yanofskybacteria bacterium RIFCSPLOWO2_12_FULL_43_11b TaxID=1802710 RepID=A0A1F8H895_9BACT|nr:MAG: hypothetical protein A2742_00505 [Candidatus Yanofskybacteria bacterium RIFCSPHIGHO2_01_FULL_43_32]OGN17873.1 MAG: hypothetical protein A3E34_00345 [Candidatus Yanofskybacteria bacterium RIFCSPHIGHO2_12_FULL_43_11]OGN24167.1 MAG: hypothetical protein A2923_02445 [Candidatus Yanofskybacteria bacterium RIFCSPLOWO2_01_FULL_43_46]OGN33801.1 MAG: hypothetical protein A3G51_04055 [Candidatus Yanofskybacteria bacterium RIFCSPLOWO2_12_FULL_43_11b]
MWDEANKKRRKVTDLEERPAGAWAWFCQAPREKKFLSSRFLFTKIEDPRLRSNRDWNKNILVPRSQLP